MILIVFTTTPNAEEAEALARKIIENKLAACVQILPQITSFYSWKGKIQKDSECLLLVKTLPERYDELEKFIRAEHSYETPEIVSVESKKLSADYLGWMQENILQ